MLKKGSTGDAVKSLQRKLKYLGYNLGPAGVDGIFGSYTESAAKKFQSDAGLTIDGTVGKQTNRAVTLCYKLESLVGHCRYVFGAEVNLSNPYPTALDCSEMVQWGVYQSAGMTIVDGAAAQYKASSATTSSPMCGDLVFKKGTYTSGISHVGMVTRKKNGVWRVVHAKGRLYGVVDEPLSAFTTSRNYAGRRYLPNYIRGVRDL